MSLAIKEKSFPLPFDEVAIPRRPATSFAHPHRPEAPKLRHIGNKSLDYVVIHVFDKSRNINRDFHIRQALLLKEMKYFTPHCLKQENITAGIDFTVHCDVMVFERLVDYLATHEIELDVKNLVNILISSNFLQMDSLVDKCLDFMKDHLKEIVQRQADFSCFDRSLIVRISKVVSPEQLAATCDMEDRMKSQIYMMKLEHMLTTVPLTGCAICNEVYPKAKLGLNCKHAAPEIDLEGNMKFNHIANPSFDLNEYVVALFVSCNSWEKVYWRLWGITSYLECVACGDIFACTSITGCQRHSDFPNVCSSESNRYMHNCCGSRNVNFAPFSQKQV